MYLLFKNQQINKNTKVDSPLLMNYRKHVLNEQHRIHEHYKKQSFNVTNDHILNQILTHLNVGLQLDIENFYIRCTYETERIADAFKLVYPGNNKLHIQNTNFYNKATHEIYIAVDTSFDYAKAYDKWEYLEPVQVLYHPFTDMNLGIPNASYINRNNEKGYAIFYINIPLLGVMYKAWEDKHNSKLEYKEDKRTFIRRYVINNMMLRHTEICFINRTMKTYLGEPVCPFTRVHPTFSNSMDDRIDDIIKYRIGILNSSDFRFNELFRVFYGFQKNNWASLIKFHDLAPTREVKWAFDAATLPYVLFWLRYRKNKKLMVNNNEINLLKREIRYMEQDKASFGLVTPNISAMMDAVKKELNLL